MEHYVHTTTIPAMHDDFQNQLQGTALANNHVATGAHTGSGDLLLDLQQHSTQMTAADCSSCCRKAKHTHNLCQHDAWPSLRS